MIKYSISPTWADKLILADKKVRYIGDEIAAVAAVDEEIAEEALELIEVDLEELPAVFDPNEAVQPGAPMLHEDAENNIYPKPYLWNAVALKRDLPKPM